MGDRAEARDTESQRRFVEDQCSAHLGRLFSTDKHRRKLHRRRFVPSLQRTIDTQLQERGRYTNLHHQGIPHLGQRPLQRQSPGHRVAARVAPREKLVRAFHEIVHGRVEGTHTGECDLVHGAH